MSARRSGDGPDKDEAGSWATETLPMAIRKELLERELRKLGFRKSESQGGSAQQQQPQTDGSSHPQADGDDGAHAG